jgi:hypothetical protein
MTRCYYSMITQGLTLPSHYGLFPAPYDRQAEAAPGAWLPEAARHDSQDSLDLPAQVQVIDPVMGGSRGLARPDSSIWRSSRLYVGCGTDQ